MYINNKNHLYKVATSVGNMVSGKLYSVNRVSYRTCLYKTFSINALKCFKPKPKTNSLKFDTCFKTP